MAKTKKKKKVSKNVENLELSYTYSGNVNWYHFFGRLFGSVL